MRPRPIHDLVEVAFGPDHRFEHEQSRDRRMRRGTNPHRRMRPKIVRVDAPLLPCHQGAPKHGSLTAVFCIPWFLRLLLAVVLVLPAAAEALPSYDEVRTGWVSTEGVLLDRHGEVIHELRVDMHGRRLDWVRLEEVSPAFVQAVIRAEDKRFYKHGGVDWLALGDAALDNLFSSRTRGASTLSMQVAAMLEASLKARHGHRTVGQKWDQMQAARDLEKKWSKRQILEAYLNLSTFRGEVQGVGAAARALFDKLPGRAR